jgi:ketosteroid isomerase-like protein
MRRLVAPLLIALGAISSPAAAQPTTRDSVLVVDSLWAQSYARNDTALALQVFAEDLVMTTSSGATRDCAAELGDIRSDPAVRMEFFRTRDRAVRLRPGMAVVTGTAEWAFAMNGQRREVRRRYTAVFARGGTLGWEMVALHMGASPPLAGQPG